MKQSNFGKAVTTAARPGAIFMSKLLLAVIHVFKKRYQNASCLLIFVMLSNRYEIVCRSIEAENNRFSLKSHSTNS